MDFTAGEMNATLMVSTIDDSTTELSEMFVLVMDSTDQPSAVEIGSPNMALVTIEDNDPGTYTHAISDHEVCLMDYACMYTCIVYSPYTIQCTYIVNVYVIGMPMQQHSSGVGVTVVHVYIISNSSVWLTSMSFPSLSGCAATCMYVHTMHTGDVSMW